MKKCCKYHGVVEAILEKQGGDKAPRLRCPKCRLVRQLRAKRKRKKELVDAFGGCCQLCGYNKYVEALSFHHKIPSEKEFEIGQMTSRYSKERLLAEAKKCALVCHNCHAEIECGFTQCP